MAEEIEWWDFDAAEDLIDAVVGDVEVPPKIRVLAHAQSRQHARSVVVLRVRPLGAGQVREAT